MEAGMADEVEKLHKNGLSYERMNKLGLEYRYLAMYLQQEIKHDEMVEQLDTKTRQFAKRQITWLKRDPEIEWFMPEDFPQISQRVSQFLQGIHS
jgi:tRNA dimethylallyltransferase